MNADIFWEIIGLYNLSTMWLQIVLFVLLAGITIFAYKKGSSRLLKAYLGALNLFIGIGFFAIYGTQAIQRYFALPLFVASGILFIYEAVKTKDDILQKPSLPAMVLIVLYCLYPLVSFMFGARFPKMVTHIMPCPVATISLALYSCTKKKNLPLIILLTLWGLTGVKSVIFAAYEDIILLLAGIYGVYLAVNEIRGRKAAR